MTGLISYASDDRELRDLTLWWMGSLSGASWAKVIAIAPFAIVILAALPRLTRALNGFLLGEAEAFHLGIDVEATKRLVVPSPPPPWVRPSPSPASSASSASSSRISCV